MQLRSSMPTAKKGAHEMYINHWYLYLFSANVLSAHSERTQCICLLLHVYRLTNTVMAQKEGGAFRMSLYFCYFVWFWSRSPSALQLVSVSYLCKVLNERKGTFFHLVGALFCRVSSVEFFCAVSFGFTRPPDSLQYPRIASLCWSILGTF